MTTENRDMCSTNTGFAASPRAVIAFLNDGIDLHERHLALLTLQRDALIGCKRSVFKALQESCEDLLGEMEEHVARRHRLVPATAPELRSMIDTWPAAQRETALLRLDQMRELLNRVRAQCAQNAVLIDNDRRYIDFELGLILSAISKSTNYVKSGLNRTLQVNRLVNRVA